MSSISDFDKIMDKVNKSLRSIDQSLARIEKIVQNGNKQLRDKDGKAD